MGRTVRQVGVATLGESNRNTSLDLCTNPAYLSRELSAKLSYGFYRFIQRDIRSDCSLALYSLNTGALQGRRVAYLDQTGSIRFRACSRL